MNLKNKNIDNILLGILIMVCFAAFLYIFNANVPSRINVKQKNSSVKYEKAEVLSIEKQSLSPYPDVKGMYLGSQDLKIKILTGEHKNEVKTVENYLSDTHNVYLTQGIKFVAEIDSTNGNYGVIVYSYNRAPVQYVFIIIFFAALCIVGGKKGLKSVLGLLFTFVCIIFLYIPMLYRGYSPVVASMIIVLLVTVVSLTLLNGIKAKTISAILGTVIGTFLAGIIAFIVGQLTHVSGLNTKDGETLSMISTQSGMQVYWLLFAGVLIAALGAAMDLSMSIASSIQEIHQSNPDKGSKELFISGMNVGKDMMGTMANTLILAFTGASINMLIIIYYYNVSYYQLINMDMVNVEIIQGITGSLAVILTVPIVSFISAKFMFLKVFSEKTKNTAA
ncbi:YibE/F family protein [Clostridium sp. 19966]|uniref:YibE/F family protein n=1 Tax=Clostridium sp. 19966 TaxID=2768166 RepID=UPI0028DE67CE|nr:YibE/F family protein [Clostridium sp. 19966]MDT8718905.1 YibE/F family protein [Clostridium sp. 19966]